MHQSGGNVKNTRGAQPIDKQVGERVRKRRIMNGLTQPEVAQKLGITFQQLQKYEKGTNRIGASRLHQISRVLNTPVSLFFEDSSGSKGRADNAPPDYLVDVMSTALGRKLIEGIAGLTDTRMRSILLELIEIMAGQPKERKPRKRR
jgi:transcriptional regulator with XRE-family HTH domain